MNVKNNKIYIFNKFPLLSLLYPSLLFMNLISQRIQNLLYLNPNQIHRSHYYSK